MQALAQFSFNKSVLYSDTAKTNKKSISADSQEFKCIYKTSFQQKCF